MWGEFWRAGGTDKAVRRLGEKRTPSGDGKSPGQHNAHSGTAPDLSGTILGPLDTSFLRRKVASQGKKAAHDPSHTHAGQTRACLLCGKGPAPEATQYSVLVAYRFGIEPACIRFEQAEPGGKR